MKTGELPPWRQILLFLVSTSDHAPGMHVGAVRRERFARARAHTGAPHKITELADGAGATDGARAREAPPRSTRR